MNDLNPIVAIVTVREGIEYKYDRAEIQEMLDDKALYECAGTLPKWLFVAGKLDKVAGFPKSFKAVWNLLEEIVNSETPALINVRSDLRHLNSIK